MTLELRVLSRSPCGQIGAWHRCDALQGELVADHQWLAREFLGISDGVASDLRGNVSEFVQLMISIDAHNKTFIE